MVVQADKRQSHLFFFWNGVCSIELSLANQNNCCPPTRTLVAYALCIVALLESISYFDTCRCIAHHIMHLSVVVIVQRSKVLIPSSNITSTSIICATYVCSFLHAHMPLPPFSRKPAFCISFSCAVFLTMCDKTLCRFGVPSV